MAEFTDDVKRQALQTGLRDQISKDVKSLPTSELGTGEASIATTTTATVAYGKYYNPIKPEPTTPDQA